MNRRSLLAVIGCTTAQIANPRTLAQESLPAPPPMTLRAADGQEQKGGIGSYCWAGVCLDGTGTPYPERPLDVTAGDRLWLDIGALGPVRQISYSIWPYITSRLEADSRPVNELAPPLRKQRFRNPDSLVLLSIDLPPGIYAIEVFADPRKEGSTSQGFTIRLLSAGSATPAATPIASPGRATPVADS